MNAKIRAEGMDRSKIMWIEHYLTDVYGPRPIGSPNHVAAANWAVKTMTSWGMKNAHLEPFTWRGVGWLPGKRDGFITSPVHANLKFEAVPWSPSTKGTVSGEVVSIVPPETPTEAELTAFLAPLAPQGEGRHRHGRRAAGRAGQLQRAAEAHAGRAGDGALRAAGPQQHGRGGRGGRRRARRSRRTDASARGTSLRRSRSISASRQFLRDNLPALRLTRRAAAAFPASSSRRTARARSTTTPRRSRPPSSSAPTTTAASSASSPTARR